MAPGAIRSLAFLSMAVGAAVGPGAPAIAAAHPATPARSADRAAEVHPESGSPGPPRLDARAWILIDAATGNALTGHDASRELPIASTTKLMTAYLALRRLRLSSRVRMVAYSVTAPGESLLGLPAGTRISISDLLYGLILRSGNDAAASLAQAMAGSDAAFVAEMNAEAVALGLAHTHYANPVGLDDPDNYSSAEDLARLSRKLLENPVFARIANSRHAVLRSVRPPLTITTRNTLALAVEWINGIKTGHTQGAGYVLLASGHRRGAQLISAVLGTSAEADRDTDSLQLLEYGFAQYRSVYPVRARQQFADPIIGETGRRLALVAAHAIVIPLRRSQHLRTLVQAPPRVRGPVAAGAAVGRVVVSVDGRPVRSVALLAAQSVPRARVPGTVSATAWTVILATVALALAILAVVLVRSRAGPTQPGAAARA